MKYSIPSKSLLACLKASLLFASKEDCRPHLHGVLFEPQENGLVVVATDGTCLIRTFISQDGGLASNGTLVTYRSVVEMVRVLSLEPRLAKRRVSFLTRPAKDAVPPAAALTLGEGSSLKAGKLTLDLTAAGESFPPYKRLLESNSKPVPPCAAISIAPANMARVGRTFSSSVRGVKVTTRGELDPVVYEGPICEDLVSTVLVMPVRT